MKRMIAGSLSQPSRFLKIFHLKVVFILFILSSHSWVFSQSSRPLAALPIDTLKVGAISDSVISFADKIQKLADDGYLQSKADYEATKEINHREAVIDEIISTIQNAKEYLGSGLDTAAIKEQIRDIEVDMQIASFGIFTEQGRYQTYRNLTTSSLILRELLSSALVLQTELDNYKSDLVVFKIKYDSLNADSLIYRFPKDSIEIVKHVTDLSLVLQEIKPADSMLKATLASIQELQIPVFITISNLHTRLEKIKKYQEDHAAHLFRREIHHLQEFMQPSQPFQDLARSSATKAKLVFMYYARNHLGRIAILSILIVFTAWFFKALDRRQKKAGNTLEDGNNYLVIQFPIASSVVIILSIFQFIFIDPPFIFNTILWLISAISLTYIFWSFITRYWLIMWIIMLFSFLLACADNLLLYATQLERYAMFVFAGIGLATGLFYLRDSRFNELKEPGIIYFIRFMVLLEALSLVANVIGLYNFSKSLFIAGYANVIIGIIFLWTIRLMNQSLAIASKSYTNLNRKQFYINFEKIGSKTPTLFYVLLVVGWIVLIGSNFYVFKQITTPLSDFLLSERTIGNYTFSVENLLVFVLIMALSMMLSKFVSYFGSDVHYSEGADFGHSKAKVGLGSWLLLVRIFIISLGLFMAFAATGLPMDRFVIVLGALGVGIGLGLQSLVNNLVSGLIIAFEKPINVGDIVELDGKHGVMKSIGFRSSTIVRVDGAQVIIPNGELISQQLVNWSMGNGKRRMEVLVGVAYGTDLEKTKDILMDILQKSERVLSIPPPLVLAQDFKDSSVEFRCNFWVAHFNEWVIAKSDIIRNIHIEFRKNGIVIPFPQQDIYIRKKPY